MEVSSDTQNSFGYVLRNGKYQLFHLNIKGKTEVEEGPDTLFWMSNFMDWTGLIVQTLIRTAEAGEEFNMVIANLNTFINKSPFHLKLLNCLSNCISLKFSFSLHLLKINKIEISSRDSKPTTSNFKILDLFGIFFI